MINTCKNLDLLDSFEVQELEQRLENKWSDKGCIDEAFEGNTDCLEEN